LEFDVICSTNVPHECPTHVAALGKSTRRRGAGLDVFAREPADPSLPVYQLPNVVVTPHTAGCTDGTTQRRAKACADNIDRFAQGLDLLYRVD